MHKAVIEYTDFEGRPQVEELYFNISKTEITDNLDLEERFEDVKTLFDGGPRDWTRAEVDKYLSLVKHVMSLAYGVRSEDGKRFYKTPAIWEDFKASAAYDSYLFSLFSEPERANEFLLGVLPADLRVEAQKEIEKNGGTTSIPSGSVQEVQDVELPDDELLKMHPADMTKEQAQRAYELRFGKQ